MNEQKQPYQDIQLLIRFRNNSVIHVEPETLESGGFADEVIEALKSKVPPSKLAAGSANPYFPNHCLGAGCAAWAVTTAKSFADDFLSRLGLLPNYQRVLSDFPLSP